MDQTCPVVHKSRRPQARPKTVPLFYIHCDLEVKSTTRSSDKENLEDMRKTKLTKMQLRTFPK
jgi:hypothetical protein